MGSLSIIMRRVRAPLPPYAMYYSNMTRRAGQSIPLLSNNQLNYRLEGSSRSIFNSVTYRRRHDLGPVSRCCPYPGTKIVSDS